MHLYTLQNTVNQLYLFNTGEFRGNGGRLEPCLEVSLENSVDTGFDSLMREKKIIKK